MSLYFHESCCDSELCRGRCHWLVWLICLCLYQKLSTLVGIQITCTMRQPSWSCASVLSDPGSMSLGRFLPRAILSRSIYLQDFESWVQKSWGNKSFDPRLLLRGSVMKDNIHDQVRCMRCGTLGHPNCGVPPKAPDAPTQPVPPELPCWTNVSNNQKKALTYLDF